MDDEVSEIGAANDEQCVRLRRALRAVPGFQFVLVEVEPGEVRHEVLRRLRGWGDRGDLGPIDVVHRTDGADLLDLIAHHPAGLVLLDVDASSDPASLTNDLQRLNWARDVLPTLLTGPLVLMLDRGGAKRLFEVAPDLASWRKHSAHFQQPTRLDLWTLHGAAPWHAVLAHEYGMTETPAWLQVLGLPRGAAHVSATRVARALRVRAWLGKHEEAELLYAAAASYYQDPEERVAIEIAGAHAALDRDALEIAERRLAFARPLIARIEPARSSAQLEFLLVDGRRAVTVGELAHGQAAYVAAVDIAKLRLDAVAVVTALVGLAVVMRAQDEGSDRSGLLREAAQQADAARSDWLQYYVALAYAWTTAGTREAIAHLADAYRLAAKAGSPEATETALRAAGFAVGLRDVPAAERWAGRADLASSVNAPAWMQQTYWRIHAWLATQRGDLRGATAHYLKARSVAPTGTHAPLDEVIGRVALDAGLKREALEAFLRARDLAATRADRQTLAAAELGVGRALLALRERLPEGVAAVERAIQIFTELGLRLPLASARRVLADVLDALGRPNEASAQRRQASEIEELLGISAARDESRSSSLAAGGDPAG